MINVIKGKKVNVTYELSTTNSGEPVINEITEDLGDTQIITLDNDITFNKNEEIYFDENTSATITNIKKTLDGTTYIYTDREIKEFDEEEKELVEKMYDKAYEIYAKNLLKKYPNVGNLLKIMGKDNLSSKEIVEAIKSFNGVQNDFFMR